MFFSSEDLSDAKPIPVEDRLEYALGIILQQYSIGAGLKKFRERGEKGVTKELAQMHNMAVFAPNHEVRSNFGREKEGDILTDVPKGKEGQVSKRTFLRRPTRTAGGLDETRDDIANRLERIGVPDIGRRRPREEGRCMLRHSGSVPPRR